MSARRAPSASPGIRLLAVDLDKLGRVAAPARFERQPGGRVGREDLRNMRLCRRAFQTRTSIAAWTGYSGDGRGALELLTALLPDLQRVLGPDHPETLNTRGNIAYWTGRSGDAATAVEQYAALLSDQQRVLGPDHPDTLITRSNIAGWTAESGDVASALEQYAALLPDLERVLGADHQTTLDDRNNVTFWTRRL